MLKKLTLLIALIVVASVVTFTISSFRAPVQKEPAGTEIKKNFDPVWYKFNGSGPGDYTDPLQYERYGPSDPPPCFGTTDLCFIKLPDNDDYPAQGSLNQEAIEDLVEGGDDIPDVVFLRD